MKRKVTESQRRNIELGGERKPPGGGESYTNLNPKRSVTQRWREGTAKFLR